jgi:hypothetical protein
MSGNSYFLRYNKNAFRHVLCKKSREIDNVGLVLYRQ